MTDLKNYQEAKERVERFRDGETLERIHESSSITLMDKLRADLNTLVIWEAQMVEPAHPVGDQEFLKRLKQLQLRLIFEQKTSDAITVTMALSRITAAALSALQTSKMIDGRDMAGETVMRMRVAAYREPIRCPPDVNPIAFAKMFPRGAGHRYSEHWSTPGPDAERLFTEADVRALAEYNASEITRLQAEVKRLEDELEHADRSAQEE